MAEIIGTKGEELSLLIRQGATFGPIRIEIRNPDGTPVDLSDVAFRGQIRKAFDSEVANANFLFEKPNQGFDGVVLMSLTAGATGAIPAGADENAPESQYVFDVEGEEPDGRVVPYFYGPAAVFREITK